MWTRGACSLGRPRTAAPLESTYMGKSMVPRRLVAITMVLSLAWGVGEGEAAPAVPPGGKDPTLQQALDGLEEEYRTVVVLRDIQHCDYREMAEILDLAPGTVKSRLHRARLMLRDKLKPLMKQ